MGAATVAMGRSRPCASRSMVIASSKAGATRRHLYLISTATVVLGMVVVLAGAFALLSGVRLIAGVGLVMTGMVEALVVAIWNGTST